MRVIESKTILSSYNGMNLYRGCTHGCIYCDARSKCYHTPVPFEDIEVKLNAPKLLDDALCRKRKKCMIGTGSMSDPYIPLEKDLGITRKCLEIIERHGFGLAIQTKSDLILRDMDLLCSINKKAKCVVQITLTTFDEHLCKIIEPCVCSTQRRVEVLAEMQALGIPTVVWLSPILPFINDTIENLRGILNSCAECGVKGIIAFGMGLTLREGSREYFYDSLDKAFPGLKERYIKTFGSAYEIPSPNTAQLYAYFNKFCSEHHILHTPESCFSYMREFSQQLSLF
ncbi:MAG: radical SAM protein [Treponema sp.]|nr:radical SAM protein [Treponema sp.]